MAFYISDALLDEYVNKCAYASLLSCVFQAIIHDELEDLRGRIIGVVKSSSESKKVDWVEWLSRAEAYVREGIGRQATSSKLSNRIKPPIWNVKKRRWE